MSITRSDSELSLDNNIDGNILENLGIFSSSATRKLETYTSVDSETGETATIYDCGTDGYTCDVGENRPIVPIVANKDNLLTNHPVFASDKSKKTDNEQQM